MMKDIPPVLAPPPQASPSGGSIHQGAVGKPGEIQRRKATELRYRTGKTPGGCYVRRAAN